MRLDEWQKYIDSEFVGDNAVATTPSSSDIVGAAMPDASPEQPVEAQRAAESEHAPTRATSTVLAEPVSAAPVRDQAPAFEEPADSPEIAVEPELSTRDTILEQDSPSGSARLIEQSHGHTAESDIAPFAEYIAVRQKSDRADSSAACPRTDLQSAAVETLLPGSSGAAGRPAAHAANAETDSVATTSLPLDLSPEAASTLRKLCTAKLPGTDTEMEAHREALLLRMRNPILTAEDAAALLGVSMPAMKRILDRGSLVAIASAVSETAGEARQTPDRKRRLFLLSDVLAWLETNSSELNP